MKKFISFCLLSITMFLFIISNSNSTTYAFTNNTDYNAKAVYLIDYNSGKVLYEKNSEEKLPVASIVKLMTIYLTCKEIEKGNLKLEDEVIASATAASMGGSQVFIEEGGKYSIGDLLKSTIVSSANDASVLLAETISGSEENFVELMNSTAKELKLDNTNYVNCTGLPTVGQFSCAKDAANLLKQIINFDTYHNYSTIWLDTLNHPNNRQSELVNTNKLIRYFEGCDGGKTGSTSEAGYCLVATAKRGAMRLIGCVLGTNNSKERFAETSKLLNFGFSNFENKEILNTNYLNNKKVNIKNGKIEEIEMAPRENLFLLINKNDKNKEIDIKISINENLIAPINIGDKIGEIFIIKNGEVIDKTDIISKTKVEKANYFDKIINSLDNWNIVKI